MFCEIMFKEEHPNLLKQINKAFVIAKEYARLKIKMIYGNSFDEEINLLIDKITISNN